MFIDACASIGQAYDRRKVDPELIQNRVQRTGSREQHKHVTNVNVFADYAKGFLFSYGVLFFTWTLRFIINGKL